MSNRRISTTSAILEDATFTSRWFARRSLLFWQGRFASCLLRCLHVSSKVVGVDRRIGELRRQEQNGTKSRGHIKGLECLLQDDSCPLSSPACYLSRAAQRAHATPTLGRTLVSSSWTPRRLANLRCPSDADDSPGSCWLTMLTSPPPW